MKELPTTTLIVATYNWPEALELCLHSCITQSVKPDEIIIADDGSTIETKNTIEKITRLTSIPMVHVWHEDLGFRLAGIRNKAIAAAQSDYIIQIDGDLILHKDFVKDHLTLAKTNQFVSGSRSLLNVSQSQKLLTSSSKVFKPRIFDFFHFGRRYYAIRSQILNNISEIFQARKNKYAYVLGANMAFWKKDLLLVNGYNEALTGWGKEDNEISVRLINAGLQLLLVKNLCILYHLHHVEAARSNISSNEAYFQKAIAQKTIKTSDGIVKLNPTS